MNTTALAVIQPAELDTIQRTGKLLAASGYFDGKGEGNQAIAMMATKIMAGREMGFGPFASVNGVHIIKGKPTIGANLMASAVKGSDRYDYRVKEMSNERCVIEFLEREGDKKVSIGVSEFTIKDATAAGLTSNDTWKKFPKNMLFARALSNGVRWYCPDVFSGNAVYVPEELGAEVDGDGNVVDTTYTVQQSGRSIVAGVENVYGEAARKELMQDLDGIGQAAMQGGDATNPWDDEPDSTPTDDELDIMGAWKKPADAQAWAVQVGACANEFEARNSFKNCVDARGGSLTKENIAAVYLDYCRKQLGKLGQKQAA